MSTATLWFQWLRYWWPSRTFNIGHLIKVHGYSMIFPRWLHIMPDSADIYLWLPDICPRLQQGLLISHLSVGSPFTGQGKSFMQGSLDTQLRAKLLENLSRCHLAVFELLCSIMCNEKTRRCWIDFNAGIPPIRTDQEGRSDPSERRWKWTNFRF